KRKAPPCRRERLSRLSHGGNDEFRAVLDARWPAGCDGLCLRVEAEGIGAVLVQVPEGRSLPAAEGVVGDRYGYRHVDADHAHIDACGEVACRVAVAGE